MHRSKQHSYLDVISALAAHIGLDVPAKLRLSQHNVHMHMPRVVPFKYATSDKLYDLLHGNKSYTNILYYEVLDIPLPDLEKLKTLNVVFANSKVEEVSAPLLVSVRSLEFYRSVPNAFKKLSYILGRQGSAVSLWWALNMVPMHTFPCCRLHRTRFGCHAPGP
jgi:hypothetical protein